MDLELVLNELSLSSAAADVFTARRAMSNLLSTCVSDLVMVPITIAELDADGELVAENATLHHASRAEHIDHHKAWISDRLRMARVIDLQGIESGRDLWRRREQMFTHLRFCDEVERQLDSIDRGSEVLQQILKRLYELEDYCLKWRDEPFDREQLPSKVTAESQATLNQYGAERSFTYAGSIRLFSWHMRMTPNAWRLYFEPEQHEHVCYIGYIGKHLPTVRFPN